jgi:CPA2 family monovalent cation:H+ antiporter-2/glutathione-regulated potassium-efflux system ancillary protein KefC/glutathione-regulated potassium-efflux system protein KefB
MLGDHGHHAVRAARTFRRHDEANVLRAAALRHDQTRLVDFSRESLRALENQLKIDREGGAAMADPGWDDEDLREYAKRRANP